MAAVNNNATTTSATGANGTQYTNSVSNDKLTNDDFLKLMLKELELQDPTKPMDSKSMMDTQLKMSTIESNMGMANSMTALQQSFAQTSLSSATNVMGKLVETDAKTDDGRIKSFKVDSVSMQDGEVSLNARELLGYKDAIYDEANKKYVNFDNTGALLDGNGGKTGQLVTLTEDGRVAKDDDGALIILDAEGNRVTQTDGETLVSAGTTPVYATTSTEIKYNDLTKIYS